MLVGFWLPVGTSEKVTLGLTVLLAFYVLGLSIQDRIPETSEFVPLIGKEEWWWEALTRILAGPGGRVAPKTPESWTFGNFNACPVKRIQ